MEKQKKCCICGGELEKWGSYAADPLVIPEADGEEMPVSCGRCYGLVLRSRLYLADAVKAGLSAEITQKAAYRHMGNVLLRFSRLPLSRKIELVRAAYPDASDDATALADAEE